MLIVQISDLHIVAAGKKTYGIAPMSDNLMRCVAHINQLSPSPELVIVTGDITDSGLPEEFSHAKQLLDELRIPYYVIPGNHDNAMSLLASFKRNASAFIGSAGECFINYVIDDFEVRLIALDSTVRGCPGGEVCEQRARWLERRLSENQHKPTLIFMHHPPLKLGVIETDVDGFAGADALADVVKKYPNIQGVLCGHVHLPTFTAWSGTIVSTAPSTGMRLLLDLTQQQPSQFLLENPAYHLHYWTQDKQLVTHLVEVKQSRSYLFEQYSSLTAQARE